jgi:hypothetical protein
MSCTSTKELESYITYAPFISSNSLITNVGQQTTYLKEISSYLKKQHLILVGDYENCDYYLFFSFTISEVDSGEYIFKREYDPVAKKTRWMKPNGEKKSVLSLVLTFYDGPDLLKDAMYTKIKEVESSVDISEREQFLQLETLIETHLPMLLKKIIKDW